MLTKKHRIFCYQCAYQMHKHIIFKQFFFDLRAIWIRYHVVNIFASFTEPSARLWAKLKIKSTLNDLLNWQNAIIGQIFWWIGIISNSQSHSFDVLTYSFLYYGTNSNQLNSFTMKRKSN